MGTIPVRIISKLMGSDSKASYQTTRIGRCSKMDVKQVPNKPITNQKQPSLPEIQRYSMINRIHDYMIHNKMIVEGGCILAAVSGEPGFS